MAQYWRFANKEALLDSVGDAVVAGLRLPDPSLGETMTALVDAMGAHPRAAPLLSHRIVVTEPGREITASSLDKLATAGFGADKAAAVAH